MRLANPLLLFVFVTALTACGDDERQGYETVPHEIFAMGTVTEYVALPSDVERSLKARRFIGDTAAFGQVVVILPVDDILFIGDGLMDPHISAWSISTGELLGRIGGHGQGPREFRYPDWILPVRSKPPQALVFDFQNRRFTAISVLAGEGLVIDSTFPMQAPVRIERPLPVKDGYISNVLAADDVLVRLDRNGAVVQRIAWDEPFTERDAPHNVGRSLLNRTFIAATPSGDRFAAAYQFANILVLFTSEGRPYATTRGPRDTEPKYYFRDNRFFWDDDNEMAYWDVQMTNDRIFAWFCGCRMGDQEHYLPSEIHVFDMGGKYLERLNLDHPVTAFAVDPENRRIYGAVETPYPLIAEWKLD
jgi:hypothetical protein